MYTILYTFYRGFFASILCSIVRCVKRSKLYLIDGIRVWFIADLSLSSQAMRKTAFSFLTVWDTRGAAAVVVVAL